MKENVIVQCPFVQSFVWRCIHENGNDYLKQLLPNEVFGKSWERKPRSVAVCTSFNWKTLWCRCCCYFLHFLLFVSAPVRKLKFHSINFLRIQFTHSFRVGGLLSSFSVCLQAEWGVTRIVFCLHKSTVCQYNSISNKNNVSATWHVVRCVANEEINAKQLIR